MQRRATKRQSRSRSATRQRLCGRSSTVLGVDATGVAVLPLLVPADLPEAAASNVAVSSGFSGAEAFPPAPWRAPQDLLQAVRPGAQESVLRKLIAVGATQEFLATRLKQIAERGIQVSKLFLQRSQV